MPEKLTAVISNQKFWYCSSLALVHPYLMNLHSWSRQAIPVFINLSLLLLKIFF